MALFFCFSEKFNLHKVGVENQMAPDTEHIAENNRRHPLQMDAEGIFAPCRAHQGDASRRSDGEQVTADADRQGQQQPVAVGHDRVHSQNGE